MTICVGYVNLDRRDHVVLGCDSQATYGRIRAAGDQRKVFRHGCLAFAACGEAPGCFLVFKRALATLDCSGTREIPLRSIEDALHATAAQMRWSPSQDDEGGTPWRSAHALVTDGATLWHFTSSFQPIRVWDFHAIGCGAEVAYGAMHAARELGAHPDDAARHAIEAACAHVEGCGGSYFLHTVNPAHEGRLTE